jgi:hypothetical protein
MATRDVRNAPKDLDEQISRDFNTLIQKIYGELSTEQYSPVYTGFFASSWKIQTMGIKSVDRVQDFEPWASIKRNHDLPTGNEGWKPKGSRPSNPQIKPRFPITKTFNFKKPVLLVIGLNMLHIL